MLWTNRVRLFLSKEELTFCLFNGYSNPIVAGPEILPRAPSHLLHVFGAPRRGTIISYGQIDLKFFCYYSPIDSYATLALTSI